MAAISGNVGSIAGCTCVVDATLVFGSSFISIVPFISIVFLFIGTAVHQRHSAFAIYSHRLSCCCVPVLLVLFCLLSRL